MPEILGQADPVGSKSPIFSRYSLRVPHWYHVAKTVQLTLIRAFQWA